MNSKTEREELERLLSYYTEREDYYALSEKYCGEYSLQAKYTKMRKSIETRLNALGRDEERAARERAEREHKERERRECDALKASVRQLWEENRKLVRQYNAAAEVVNSLADEIAFLKTHYDPLRK